MVRVKLVLLILLIIGLTTADVDACSCMLPDPSPCQPLPARGQAAFVGTLVNVENPPPNLEEIDNYLLRGVNPPPEVANPDLSGLARYHFRVDEHIAGRIEGELDVYGGRGGGGDCSYHFPRAGVQYLVFVYQTEDGRFFQEDCSPTSEIAQAAALLPQLRALRDGLRVASLFGILEQGALSAEESDKDWSYEERGEPLPYTTVFLRDESGKTWRTESAGHGEYAFYGLPAGTYHLLAGEGSDKPTPPIVLPGNACYEYRYPFEAVPTGEIWGRVFDANGELLDEPVSLIPIEQYSEREEGRREYPDDNGYFHFLHVAPGKYYLVFNNQNVTDSEQPFPRNFFPGTTNREEAIEIEIREGGRYPNADIRLSRPPSGPASPP